MKLKTGEEHETCAADPVRNRIIDATFHVLIENGYTGASTREIARRAKVSKRELYTRFSGKEDILAAMIAQRAARIRQPLTLPEATTRTELAETLRLFGISLLREGTSPAVIALFRLAIAEADRAPDLGRQLDEHGGKPIRAALAGFLARATQRGLVAAADMDAMASQFLAFLRADLQVRLLLRLTDTPSAEEVERRASVAVTAWLTLYPEPVSRER